jgi:hypothetical protein
VVGGSDLTSSPCSGDITDNMESSGISKMTAPFVVGVSVWTLSVAGGQRLPESVGRLSRVPMFSSLVTGQSNVTAMERD